MKRVFFFLFPLLFAVAIAVLAVSGIQTWLPGLDENTILAPVLPTASSLIAGGIVFCITLVLINHFIINRQLDKLSKFRAGTVQYEKEIKQRFEMLAGQSAKNSDIERIERQINSLKNRNILQSREILTEHPGTQKPIDDPVTSRPIVSVSDSLLIEENPNIIPLDRAKRNLAAARPETPKYRAPSGLPQLIASDSALKIHLQPQVTIPDRNVPGYEVLARIQMKNGKIVPASAFMAKAKTGGIVGDLDRETLNQTIALLRSLRRKSKAPMFFWNMAADTLATKSVFLPVREILEVNTSLNEHLTIEISQEEFKTLGKKQLARLHTIREMGFHLLLDNCTQIESTLQNLKSGLFSYVKLPVTFLEQIEETGINIQGHTIGEILHHAGAIPIVTHVEREDQVLHLIDHDIQIAQGHLFSLPKAPKEETTTDISAENQL